ncbi:hypothetical protein LTR62_005483 [Meristemomyces frigidus]|uniref:Methyltransferase type 11 domain-containing protein n=1 Tax=Meristemomyces frigidus TaxID=1508187 RepID=A0AAN7TEC8_9PEZI|nr:hypothetical protein LTR62_005483 [Meristemomyces frigidus]
MSSRNDNRPQKIESGVLGMLPPTVSHPTVGRAVGGDHDTSRLFTTPPLPSIYAPSATPSTRYNDSPFSHAPTPSSASSYSSAALAPSDYSNKARVESPADLKSSVLSRPGRPGSGLYKVSQPPASSLKSTLDTEKTSTATGGGTPRPQISRKSINSTRTPSYANATASSKAAQKPIVVAQAPPELAHLNVDPPRKQSLDKPLPPLRPSRANTPHLAGVHEQSHVVQSDLPNLYTTYHKRTPSQETPVSATSSSFRQRFGLSSRASSRQPSPRIDSAISPPPSARLFARGPTPDLQSRSSQKLQRRPSPAVGSAPSPSKSPRFAFLSRKPKSDALKLTEKPKREVKKGPAAGTGHEGYGRYGVRGRSSSVASSEDFRSPSTDSNTTSISYAPALRKASTASSVESAELENFIRERQKPVILRGSGSTYGAANSSLELVSASRHESSNSSSVDSYRPQLLPSAMQGDAESSPTTRPFPPWRLPSDSSEENVKARDSNLAARRSIARMPQSEKRMITVPAPINTGLPAALNPMSSNDTGRSTSRLSSNDSSVDVNKQNEPLTAKQLKMVEPKLSRKWNFFQRAQASSRPKGKGKVETPHDLRDPSRGQRPYDHVAPYAMLDGEETLDLYDVQQILQQTDISAEESAPEDQYVANINVVPYERRHTALLPSPPALKDLEKPLAQKVKPTPPKLVVPTARSAPPVAIQEHSRPSGLLIHTDYVAPRTATFSPQKPYPHTQEPINAVDGSITPVMGSAPFPQVPGSNDNSPRQPRLSPIGRIPQVVSKRDRDRKLPDVSFSRPFATAQPRPTVKPPGALYHQIRELASPIEGGSQPPSSTSARSEGFGSDAKSGLQRELPRMSTNRTSKDISSNNDFLAFPPRKHSDASYTNTSSSTASWMMPLPRVPQVEDPWTEYNDLLDDMMPRKTPLSTCSPLDALYQYKILHCSPALPTPLYHSQPPLTELPAPPRSQTVPAVLSVPQQINRFLQPSMSPLATPHTLADLYDAYNNRYSTQSVLSRSSLPPPFRESATKPNRTSLPLNRVSMGSISNTRQSRHSRSTSLPDANSNNNSARSSITSLTASARFKRDTKLLDIAEDDADTQTGNSNLRFAALMTSKWLSFGRVMFSPAENNMKCSGAKVLILDGLGSDWSYHVALTYPNVDVHNLGPGAASGSSAWPGINQRLPPNHRHHAHTSISAVFPFPKGLFTAVLLRFPPAATDTAYQTCISECKRVLKPGGHLELVAIDLDLVNMGSKGRSSVRGLKTRMQSRDPNVSLRNVSDVLVRMIGRRGFEEVQRCAVGVPAAGRIPSSHDHQNPSDSATRRRSSRDKSSSDSSDQELNFHSLLESTQGHNSSTATAVNKSDDEGITKMVAKVGRWWYSTCYEVALLPTDPSIWTDHALLRECEKQGTSFRLLICHAQKPAQARRRTVSV